MAKRVSVLAFLLLLAIAAHFSGVLAANRGWESQRIYETLLALRATSRDGEKEPPTLARAMFQDGATKAGFAQIAPDGPTILIPGGPGLFTSECGDAGCLAVAFGRDGKAVQRWRYDADALLNAKSLRSGEYSYAGNDRAADISVTSIQPFADGDLLLTLNLAEAYPYGFGLVRLAADGDIRWRLADFYHHRPTIGADERIYSPYYELRDNATYADADPDLRGFVLCRAPERQYADQVHVLGSDGSIDKRIDLIGLFLKDKRYGSYLSRAIDPCDPLHLNSVDVATTADAGGPVAEGDILVSLRGPSLVALIDAAGQRIKRIYAGSFAVQHAARFAGNGEFLVFDNMGARDGEYPSRILAVAFADGRERTIRARSAAGDPTEYSTTVGDIALSPDGKRALIAYTQSGTLIEIDLASGRELSRYRHAHAPGGQGKARLFKLFTANYALP